MAAILVAAAALLSTGCNHEPPDPPQNMASAPTTSYPATEDTHDDAYAHEGAVGADELPPPAVEQLNHVDELEPVEAQNAAQTAARFIAVWTEPDLQVRARELEGVASDELRHMATDPRFSPIAAAPEGPVHLVDQGAMLVTAQQRLTDGTSLEVVLVIDPDATWGWIVISLQI